MGSDMLVEHGNDFFTQGNIIHKTSILKILKSKDLWSMLIDSWKHSFKR